MSPMTKEERAAVMLELKEQGLSLKEIGERVGLSSPRVWQILNGYRAGGPADANGAERKLATGRSKKEHRCATPGCGALVHEDHAIHSDHTNHYYCYTGEGCWLWSARTRKKKRLASIEAGATTANDEPQTTEEQEPEYGYAVVGKGGVLGRYLTREDAEELQRTSGGTLVPMTEVPE